MAPGFVAEGEDQLWRVMIRMTHGDKRRTAEILDANWARLRGRRSCPFGRLRAFGSLALRCLLRKWVIGDEWSARYASPPFRLWFSRATAERRPPMRLLFVADLHYSPEQFGWLRAHAAGSAR